MTQMNNELVNAKKNLSMVRKVFQVAKIVTLIFAVILAILAFISTSLITTVFVALILWSIYTLFKYACVLQKESDETL